MYTHREAPIEGMVRMSGRGLCNSCHSYARKRGELYKYPRVTRAIADVVEDVEFLQRERGMTINQIAEYLGYKTRDSLTRALLRYRQREAKAA
jgi:AraC-like DNA-binding protein